ncbi:MAG: class I tRNA ligase family protein, partial [Clostridia bacterium]|nr:class I tRNA ligase family protein [Clostridia bacterium]
LVKPRFSQDNDSNLVAQNTLVYVLSNTLKLLHPFMPFITEEIWQALPHEGESIMISAFPTYNADFEDKESCEAMQIIMDSIKGIRNIRNEMNVPPSKKAKLFIVTEKAELFSAGSIFYTKLASASEVVICKNKDGIPENSVSVASPGGEFLLPLDDLVDKAKEIERLEKEKTRLEGEIKRVDGKLSNKGFTDKAPAAVVEEERKKGEQYKAMLAAVLDSLEKLK